MKSAVLAITEITVHLLPLKYHLVNWSNK